MTSFAPRHNNCKSQVKQASRPRRWLLIEFICAALMVLIITTFAIAGLAPLEDTDMDAVWGSAGIMIAVKNVQIFHHTESIRYCAPFDAGYIEFQDFIMGGDGDVARFNYDFGSVTKSGIMFF